MNEMIRDEIAKGPVRRPRVRTIVAASVAGAVLIGGGVFGVSAANAYRADIEAMQTNTQELRDEIVEQRLLADEAADRAEGFADAASESTDSIAAAEAEAAALAEAEAAAAAAAAAQEAEDDGPGPSNNLPPGATPPNVPGTDQPDSTACASSALVWDGSKSVCA